MFHVHFRKPFDFGHEVFLPDFHRTGHHRADALRTAFEITEDRPRAAVAGDLLVVESVRDPLLSIPVLQSV